MSWTYKRCSLLSLVLLLAVGAGCTSREGSSEALGPSAEQQQSPLGLIGGLTDLTDGLSGTTDGLTDAAGDLTGTVVGTLGSVTNLLACTEQPHAVAVKGIGPKGGSIVVGTHRLDIPAGALSKKVLIKAEQIPGSTNSVRFTPEELGFEKPAKLTMSYENCAVVLLRKSIVYTDESLDIREVLRSIDVFGQKRVSAPINHFSRYAVAY